MGCHPWVFSLPRCALLSEKRAPLTGFAPFAGCFITLRRPSLPASNRRLGKDIEPDIRKKFLWKSVCGSLRGCNCYKNISISKVCCRQKGVSFFQPAGFPGLWKRKKIKTADEWCSVKPQPMSRQACVGSELKLPPENFHNILQHKEGIF